MFRIPTLAAALATLLLAGCGTPARPVTAKDAAEAAVAAQEAERAFLYPGPEQLARLGPEDAPPSLYAVDPHTEKLRALSPERSAEMLGGREAVLALTAEPNAATVNLWNWVKGEFDSLHLRLDSLSSRPVDGDDGGRLFEVVFSARETALWPFSGEADFELFRARLRVGPDAAATLLQVRQVTDNAWDDTEPAFSPDGRWIVFLSDKMGPRNVALMDRQGDFLRLLTENTTRNCDHPVVLPGSRRCLYVSSENGMRRYYVRPLTGGRERKASPAELRDMLFSWDDDTRHRYLLTDLFRHHRDLHALLELPETVDLKKLVALAEWNSPVLKQYRQKILAARAERERHGRERGPEAAVGATHLLDVGTLMEEPPFNPGDRPTEGFTRYLFTFSFPLFTGSLDRAVARRDRWQEMVYSQTYRKQYNDLVHRVARHYAQYSRASGRARIRRRMLDLQRKRVFLLRTRAESGRELPAEVQDAEAKVQEAEADLQESLARREAARQQLAAVLGVSSATEINMEPLSLDWESVPFNSPPVEEMQALAQINHPGLERLKFLELRAAAIRDMGPPESRRRPRLDLTYGYGQEHFFSRAVDDFISAGLGHVVPLATRALQASYREQWTHEMLAHRRERQAARADLNADLRELSGRLRALNQRFRARKRRRQAEEERLRLARIYHRDRRPAATPTRSVTDVVDVGLELMNRRLDLIDVRADLYEQTAAYYHRAGLARQWLRTMDGAGEAGPRRTRSVWLWKSLEIALDPERRKRFLRTCEAQGVRRVYCLISRVENEHYLSKYPWEFGYFLDRCREAGIEAYALVGNPHWVEPGYRSEIGALLTGIQQFNNRREEGKAAFTGLKLDIEPHALPGWSEPRRRKELVDAYLRMIEYVKKRARSQGSDIAVAVDVPHTYTNVAAPGGSNLFQAVCERLDELTLMAYRDDAAEIVTKARRPLQVAERHGVKLEIGIETNPGAATPASFAGRSPEELMVALDAVYEKIAPYAAFAGFAIHDYAGLVNLVGEHDGR